jgi:hypothetical protein
MESGPTSGTPVKFYQFHGVALRNIFPFLALKLVKSVQSKRYATYETRL